jgi:hypothetical protein
MVDPNRVSGEDKMNRKGRGRGRGERRSGGGTVLICREDVWLMRFCDKNRTD